MAYNNNIHDHRPSYAAMTVQLFVALAAFRLVNAWLLQTQFDPDEYWQTLEPAYCLAFESPCAYTWEWTRKGGGEGWEFLWLGPIRSHLTVLPTYFFYKLLTLLPSSPSPWILAKGPLFLHAVLVAAPTDYAVYSIAQPLSCSRWALFCSLSAWFHAYALVRTYSNAWETMLFMVGLALLAHGRAKGAFVLGGFSVAIRFSSLALWVPLGILWSIHSSHKSQFIRHLLSPCALYGLVGLVLSLLVDRLCFGYWVLPFLGNFYFNVVEGLGWIYGTHSWHWYITQGLPAVLGFLLPLLLWDVLQNGCTAATLLLAVTLVLHSLSPHKEFRFLLPLVPLTCIPAGRVLQTLWHRRFLLTSMVFLHGLVVLYLGLLHQRAPLSITRHLAQRPDARVDFLTECHSTPLYSHGIKHARYLDCSPSCRVTQTCESHGFVQDPLAFVKEHYYRQSINEQGEHLHLPVANLPDNIVLFAKEAAVVHSTLMDLGYRVEKRFFHKLVGVDLFGLGHTPHEQYYSHWNIAEGLDLWVDEMVLYSRRV
jgi:phosphatidylinositol glycan class B